MKQQAKAVTTKKAFSRTTKVSIEIDASAQDVWNHLTDAVNFSSWNSTVISLEGIIKLGAKIKLKSTLDPSRTFTLKVKEMNEPREMVWADAMGKRIYTLKPAGKHTLFTMEEKIGGPLFPLFANQIPSFDDPFEAFARDLKKVAEDQSENQQL